MSFEWMAWTPPTAVFFVVIGLILAAMTVWQLLAPSPERRGFLPIATTPGDRLFVGLLGAAFLQLAWIGLTELSVWIALVLALVWLAAVMRWG